jgi:O-antigen/teichoic acid export membrane protein
MLTTTIVGMVQLAVLTRLLSRSDFGLMAMIVTIVGFAQVYADMGFSGAIIYRQDATRDQLSTLYWMNLVASFVIFLAVAGSSPLVAVFHEPGLRRPMLWASLLFLVTPVGQQFQMLLQKELLFKRLGLIEITASFIGLGVAVASGIAHQGVYALIWAQLALATTKATLLASYGWRRWRPHLHVRFADLKGYVGFGAYQMGERSIYYWAANIDYLLIGRFLGAAPLGLYTIAFQLVVVPVNKLSPVLTRVAFPVFSRRQHDDAALRRGYCELIELVAFVTFPLLIGLAVTGPVAVKALFGAAWLPSVVLVRLLVPMGMMMTIGSPSGSLYLAKGRADVGFWYNVVNTAVVVAALYVAVHYGTRAVSASQSLVAVAMTPLELYLLWRLSRLHPLSYLRCLAAPLLSACLMGACVYATYLGLRSLLPAPACLAVLVVEGMVIYVAIWRLTRREYIPDLWRLLRSRG